MQPKLLLDYELAVSQSGYVARALLKLEGQAPDTADAGRVPLDLSVVLDRSGSMDGPKLTAACEAAALLVRRLRRGSITDVTVHAYVLTAGGRMERRTVRFPIAAPLARAGKQELEVRREAMPLEAAWLDGIANDDATLREDAEDLATLREDAEDLAAMRAMFDARSVSAADAKYMGQRAYNTDRRKQAYQAKLRRKDRGPEA